MKAKRITAEQLAKLLFDHRYERGYGIDFYETYNEESEEAEWAHRIEIISFAGTEMAIGNYYGGGSSFAYDFNEDTDERALVEALNRHFKLWGIQEIFIEIEDIQIVEQEPVGIYVIVSGGMVFDIFSTDMNVTTEIIDLDTQDPEKLEANENRMEELRMNLQDGSLYTV